MVDKDDMIKMANDAGIKGPAPARAGFKMYASPQRLLSFAALVAAAEREKVARWMIAKGYATGHADSMEDLLQELDWQIVEAWNRALINGITTEREACAKLFDGEVWAYDYREIAAAIRARGEQ
ncbi:MAG: hypothetical protein EBR82_54990 [Caulobacteraceae bacterium]|nr:hypothetical protein [Caulobacteraceae bacterium]